MIFKLATFTLAATVSHWQTLSANANLFDHPSSEGRRKGKLGHASQQASAADCGTDISLQLYQNGDDSEILTFQANPAACRSGKNFVGQEKNGRPFNLNSVPGKNGSFAASVVNEETGAVHSIAADANGEMTTTTYSPEDYDEEHSDDTEDYGADRALFEVAPAPVSKSSVGGLRGSRKAGNQQRDLQSLTQIDILVVWTDYAECANSGLFVNGVSTAANPCTRTSTTETNMRTKIDLAVQETNVAYSMSGVNMELNLVHAAFTEYTETETNPSINARNHLQADGDGYMDEVHGLRTQYGADMVVLITGARQYCGMAFGNTSPEYMFSVTRWNCATGHYTFGHEIAHNFGCRHDKGRQNQCDDPSKNFGYRDPDAEFVTILGDPCNQNMCPGDTANSPCGTRIQRFSNSQFTYGVNDKPLGNATIDNAAHMNDIKDIVAAYYSPPPPSASPTVSPTTAGPTSSPTTAEPTSSPSNAPTASPTPFSCGLFASKNSCEAWESACEWIGGSVKECRDVGGDPVTTTTTEAPPPGGCTPAGETCDGNCCNSCHTGGGPNANKCK